MSFLKAVIAVWIWSVICLNFIAHGADISPDIQVLTTAIIAAGALAGGDK